MARVDEALINILFPHTYKPNMTFMSMIHPKHITEAIATTFKPRHGHKRKVVLIGILNQLLQILPTDGEKSVEYLFFVRIFGWGVSETSAYRTFYSIVTSLGLAIFMPLFHMCGLPDLLILLLVTLTQIAARLVWGFSTEGWMFYIGTYVYYRDVPFIVNILWKAL